MWRLRSLSESSFQFPRRVGFEESLSDTKYKYKHTCINQDLSSFTTTRQKGQWNTIWSKELEVWTSVDQFWDRSRKNSWSHNCRCRYSLEILFTRPRVIYTSVICHSTNIKWIYDTLWNYFIIRKKRFHFFKKTSVSFFIQYRTIDHRDKQSWNAGDCLQYKDNFALVNEKTSMIEDLILLNVTWEIDTRLPAFFKRSLQPWDETGRNYRILGEGQGSGEPGAPRGDHSVCSL